jgi:gamma-glutamylputrescine oxidase
MAATAYPDSFYAATAVGAYDHPRLQGAHRADVCVIGGGFTGLSTALNLAEQGFDVILLEAERVGFGASGRNGGLIGSGQRKDVVELEEQFGLQRSREFWSFAEAAKTEIRERVAKHNIDCDLQDGQVEGVHKKSFVGMARETSDVLAERYDYPHTKALTREETRELIATDDFFEGLQDTQAMTIHPLNYALGLARAAREAGVRIFDDSRVLSYTRTDPATVTTAEGTVEASFIVLGCNGYLGKLESRLAGKIMPINNFLVATEALDAERANALIAGRFGIHDTRFVVNFFRMSDDRRLLFGGGESYRAGFPKDIANFVRPKMLSLFPQLEDVRLDYAWGGTLSVTVNRLPHVGRLAPNLFFAQGYSGHGISISNFAGKIIAEAISGTAGRFDVFASLPTHTFPGGTLLRYPGMVLGMLYYSLKDRL